LAQPTFEKRHGETFLRHHHAPPRVLQCACVCCAKRAILQTASTTLPVTMSVLVETTAGDIVIDLLVDNAPKLCEK
jgi:hypothetical protein